MESFLTRLLIPSLCALSVAACTDTPPSISAKSDAQIVVIEVDGETTNDGQKSGGYIEGIGPKGSYHSAGHTLVIADAVLACAIPTVTIDTTFSHVSYITFASASSFKDDGFIRPTDFEVIKCVQRRVSIPFRPGIAQNREELVAADFSPFEALSMQ